MADIDPGSLAKLKVVELKAELKKLNLPVAGLKQQLIDRLREALLQQAARPADEAQAPPQPQVGQGEEAREEQSRDAEAATNGDIRQPAEEPAVAGVGDNEPPSPTKRSPTPTAAEELSKEPLANEAPLVPSTATEAAVEGQPKVDEASPAIEAEVAVAEDPPKIGSPPMGRPPMEELASRPKDENLVIDRETAEEPAPSPTVFNPPPQVMEMDVDEKSTGSPGKDVSTSPDALSEAREDGSSTAGDIAQDVAMIESNNIAVDESVIEAINKDANLPIPNDVPPINITNDVMDASDLGESLKRKRRSTTPPPPPVHKSESVDPDTTSPFNKKQKQSPGSPTRRAQPPMRDARFKGLFNSKAPADPANTLEEDDEAPVSPSIHPATRALYIRDFVRPLNEVTLRNHLITLATRNNPSETSSDTLIEHFFLDSIKSHAFILFSNLTAATRVRVGIHSKIFPNEKNRKPLWADFIPEDKVKAWIDREKSAVRGTTKWEVIYDTIDGEAMAELVEAGTGAAGFARPRTSVDISNAPSGPRRSTQRQDRKKIVMNLDELFMSTKTKPKLYYLPVNRAIAEARLAKEGRGSMGRRI